MATTKPPRTLQADARRAKAFELYSVPDEQGKRRSNRAIAQAVGVTPPTVGYWKDRDRWDDRLNADADATQKAAIASANNIKAAIRRGLDLGIGRLTRIITSTTSSDKNVVAATKELASIAKQLDALTPDGLADIPTGPTFTDDVTHDPEAADPGTTRGDRAAQGPAGQSGSAADLDSVHPAPVPGVSADAASVPAESRDHVGDPDDELRLPLRDPLTGQWIGDPLERLERVI